jgi:hypothetical protein
MQHTTFMQRLRIDVIRLFKHRISYFTGNDAIILKDSYSASTIGFEDTLNSYVVFYLLA